MLKNDKSSEDVNYDQSISEVNTNPEEMLAFAVGENNLPLNQKEISVLNAFSLDIPRHEIAGQLGFSEMTVKIVADCATSKLNCKTLIGAISVAVRKKYI